jgi:hypothetical protein
MTDPCTLGQWCFGLLSDFIVCKFDGGFCESGPTRLDPLASDQRHEDRAAVPANLHRHMGQQSAEKTHDADALN